MMPKSLRSFSLFLVPALLAGTVLWATDQPDPAAHRKEIEDWRAKRNESLKKEDSWLTLAGLFWLKPGENRFGSDPGKNVVILPKGKAPAVAGAFVREGDKVTLRVEPGVALTADGQAPAPGLVVKKDTEGKPTALKLGSLTFHVIQRGDRIGVRIKDSASAVRASFHGLDTYPVRPEWRVVARFEPYTPPKPVKIPNVLGQVDDIPSPGAVVFDWKGKTYRIDAIPGGDKGE
ncbi:MAG TPA: DUF1684 domain-containing protein, partial [Thermoanaerobaculia bacterium]|nr:DUF1684 domain-containing protein [Thermoanaerobaculia bacterium]